MQTVNNNKPEQINSALFAISDDITKQNIQTKNAIKSSEAGLQKQIDKLTDSLKNNGGLITGGTYNINISGNASTATNATNATNADKATKDSAGNTIATTYAKKTEVPTKTSQLTNDSGYITSSGSITGNAATATTATNVTYGVAHNIGSDIGLDTNKAYMSMVHCAPDGQIARWWHIITDTWENADTVWKAQIAYPTLDSVNNNGDKGKAMWYRWKINDTSWGAWQRLARFDEIPTSLPANGGTANKVASAGDSVMWIQGRAYAIVKTTTAASNDGWKALASIKTASGSIEIGNLTGEDFIRLAYSSDANVNSGTNDVTHIARIGHNGVGFFPKVDATIAGIRIPTSKPSTVSPGDIWIE